MIRIQLIVEVELSLLYFHWGRICTTKAVFRICIQRPSRSGSELEIQIQIQVLKKHQEYEKLHGNICKFEYGIY